MNKPSSQTPDHFDLDPARHPVKINLQLPRSVLEKLQHQSSVTGRSIDELILEILDNSLEDT